MKRPLLIAFLLTPLALAADAPPKEQKDQQVTLRMRKDNGPYKSAAYSFRKATADEALHHNYVDLLLNRCGSLHINMTTGQQNRLCDLGQIPLKDAPNTPPANPTWLTESVKPEPDHTYLEELHQNGESMAVKFHVDALTPDTVQFTWLPTQPLAGQDNPHRGASGRKGQCGGPHNANK